MKTARYGWVRQLPDHRDLPRGAPLAQVLPEKVDLRPFFPSVWDQGQIGSCTGHACAAALAYARATEDLPALTPSRLMLYYNARYIEGTTAYDAGAQIRDVIKGAALYGACPETLWPYDERRFALAPTQEAYAGALRDRALAYHYVDQTLAALKAALADGDAVVFGFSVYDSFESEAMARSGRMTMPSPSEALVGGHAVIAVGYDDASRCFTIRNSWGADWGDVGYFYMPYEYITDPKLASDFWTIQLVTYQPHG